MPRPRITQISVEDTPFYHCCSRVVRFNGTSIGNKKRKWYRFLLLKLMY